MHIETNFKLRYEAKVKHIFMVGNTDNKFKIILVKYPLLHIIFWTLFGPSIDISFAYRLVMTFLRQVHRVVRSNDLSLRTDIESIRNC